MYFATKTPEIRVITWLIWVISLLVIWSQPLVGTGPGLSDPGREVGGSLVLLDEDQQRGYFPWRGRGRIRKWAGRHYQRLRRAQRRARWAAQVSKLVLSGAVSLATVIDGVTTAQVRRQVGALPVVYAVVEVLQVRQIINRYCPTAAEIDHGTVAVVLVLNRLMAPRALYKIADWLGQTILVHQLGVAAEKFNDDRLGRTLDALSGQTEAIWQDLVDQAIRRGQIDLSVIFYDLSAYVAHGAYAASELVGFGFAHNTPMNKQKVKLGLAASADGAVPLLAQPWPGPTADKATVQTNMQRLVALLKRHPWPVRQTLLIGDRANLDDALALAYDEQGLRYLAGLPATKKAHRDLLLAQPTGHFYRYPLTTGPKARQWWGIPCLVPFEHDGRQVSHRGLVVLSNPMTTALRQARARHLRALRHELTVLRAKIGQPHYRTPKALQRSVQARLKASAVGQLMHVEVYFREPGQLDLRWQIDTYQLWRAMHRDGRYLLVTNDFSLSPVQMLAHYRRKDGVEKRFQVTKSDFQLSPLYVHLDTRIRGLLLVNLIALLAYSLLERQMRLASLSLTTRRLIERLDPRHLIEPVYLDGSCQRRLSPLDPTQTRLFAALAPILADLAHGPAAPLALPAAIALPWVLSPPPSAKLVLPSAR